MKSARTMYGWNIVRLGDDYCGGCPPDLDDISTDRNKISPFINALLCHITLHPKMKNILVANAIRFFDDFVKLLKKEPRGTFLAFEDMKEKHIFVRNVSIMLYICYEMKVV